MKIDPARLRRRNFCPGAFPTNSGGAAIRQRDTLAPTKRLTSGYSGFAGRRPTPSARQLRNISFAAYVEATGVAPSAVARSAAA
jgi:hypothetical protein